MSNSRELANFAAFLNSSDYALSQRNIIINGAG
jgi:hypothetical protein